MMSVSGVEKTKSDLRRFSELTGINLGTVVKKLTIDIFGDLVQGTPIDTGRAMNNWVISIGVERHKLYPGLRGNMRGKRTLSTGGSKSELMAKKAKEAQEVLARYSPTQVIYITNSLNYIVYLNEGSSKQAPANFVQNAVLRHTTSIKEALKAA